MISVPDTGQRSKATIIKTEDLCLLELQNTKCIFDSTLAHLKVQQFDKSRRNLIGKYILTFDTKSSSFCKGEGKP